MALISCISGSVAILKIFFLNLGQLTIVTNFHMNTILGKFLTNGLRESPSILRFSSFQEIISVMCGV
jgi:hypothetical protein